MGINIGLDIQRLYALGLLDRLLKDKTTGHNILWATDAYSALGIHYGYDEPLSPALITGSNAEVIQAWAQKGQARRNKRTRQHGEVCTPLWVVKKMIDHADEVWFGAPNRFFVDREPTRQVQFDRENDWQRYVDSRRLEITCGEAPYLATRYDVETGEEIPLAQRIGILDRKLRVVGENTDNETDWLHWAMRAFEACYGYELQGDSLLTARVNLLMTFADYYSARWNKQPVPKLYGKFLNRIVWNVWQMDGLTGTLPCAEESDPRLTLADFAGASEGETAPPIPPPRCRIYDWRRKQSLEYLNMQGNGAKTMRFDYILGNPPYQEENALNNRQSPIYHVFMEESYSIATIVELITPARFLFNAGQTPKAWNKKMLSDDHLKVLMYERDCTKIFPSTDIKGGVAITLRNALGHYGAIGVFIVDEQLDAIKQKIIRLLDGTLRDCAYPKSNYGFSSQLYRKHPELRSRLTEGNEFILDASIFVKMPEIFHEDPFKGCVGVHGRLDNHRVCKYVKSDYIKNSQGVDKFKVFVTGANGTGKFGDVLSTPFVGKPNEVATQTYMSFGFFDTFEQADNLLKYLRTKFARCMLSILKITQNNPKDTWAYVPLQDFTPTSDIDWSQPIPAIDRQLYAKYGLDEQEIAFIESHVKEME